MVSLWSGAREMPAVNKAYIFIDFKDVGYTL